MIKREKSLPNDIIRIFGIACSNESRDDICKLTESKAFSRADLDGALHFTDSIFFRWAESFNDPDYILQDPPRAKFLSSYIDLDPNDETRINIMRDYKWVKNVYRTVMKKYNAAMKRWKMETGGGPGAPENFAGKWEDRENLELFSNYADSGSCDYLAYILMYDKDVGFTLNAVNDPAPAHTVMENGLAGGGVNEKGERKRTRGEIRMAKEAKEIATMFGSVITDSIGPLMKSITTTPNVAQVSSEQEETQQQSDTYRKVNGMSQTMGLINSLEIQIERLEVAINLISEDSEEGKKKKRRLEILNKMHDDSFEKLLKFQG